MGIPGILLCMAILVLIAALIYADCKWRQWMAARRQQRGGGRELEDRRRK